MKHRRRQSAVRRKERQNLSSLGREKWIREQGAEKHAESFIHGLQKEFPEKSLIQLLPWVAARNRLAAKIMVERIRRNRGDKLSPEDLVFLQQVDARLAEQKDCSAC